MGLIVIYNSVAMYNEKDIRLLEHWDHGSWRLASNASKPERNHTSVSVLVFLKSYYKRKFCSWNSENVFTLK
jgi:hypothetical protein